MKPIEAFEVGVRLIGLVVIAEALSGVALRIPILYMAGSTAVVGGELPIFITYLAESAVGAALLFGAHRVAAYFYRENSN